MRALFSLVVGLVLVGGLRAQEPGKLRVGVFEREPFAMKDERGQWTGLAIGVWERVSAEVGLPFAYVETTLGDAIGQTARGELDVVVGEVAVSADRERAVDFSQPYLASPAAVAVRRHGAVPHWLEFFRDVLAHGVLSMLVVLIGSMLLFSFLLWLVERRVERSHFAGNPWHGLGSALWFSAVTMTTVGYGDKTPQSVGGRVVVFFWMFLGVVVISVFTGTVASSIALSRTESTVRGLSDLARYRNGVVADSLPQTVLSGVGIPAKSFPSVEAGLRALAAGEITAFFDTEITLRYAANQNHAGDLLVVPLAATHVSYALAARPRLRQLEAINVALIDEIGSPGWEQEVERWTGPPVR